jgi:hypothetical protein
VGERPSRGRSQLFAGWVKSDEIVDMTPRPLVGRRVELEVDLVEPTRESYRQMRPERALLETADEAGCDQRGAPANDRFLGFRSDQAQSLAQESQGFNQSFTV